MFHKALFILGHQCIDRNFYPRYKILNQNQWKNYEELKERQEKNLRQMIKFAYHNVPYYHKLFDNLKLNVDDIKKIEDLEKLPILTKEIIKNNWEEFKPANLDKMKYYNNATGGSTGTPFRYRLHKFDRLLGSASMYHAWGFGGYRLGDKTIFIGGSSLSIGAKPKLAKNVNEFSRNIKMLSSFDMDEEKMKQYVNVINSFKPKFIRGYASSIYFLSKWIEENDVKIHQPLATFTTAEKLYPNMREKIRDVFYCDVYDGYGLNDGGIHAAECPEHSGLHIITERNVTEIVDEETNQLSNGEGKIIATSLYNYAMPFIRYDTGDIGNITDDVCSCGRGYTLLKDIVGRSVDFLITPEGKNVHGWFFLYIFWEFSKGIKEYQVIQKKLDKIIIKIVREDDFEEKRLDQIREIVREKSEEWDIEFKFVDKIDRTKAGKYKFIINEIN